MWFALDTTQTIVQVQLSIPTSQRVNPQEQLGDLQNTLEQLSVSAYWRKKGLKILQNVQNMWCVVDTVHMKQLHTQPRRMPRSQLVHISIYTTKPNRRREIITFADSS